MLIEYKGGEYNLPDFLIVGAAKSGTTSLYYYLKQHPRLFMPEVKELYFFSFFKRLFDFKSPDNLKKVVVADISDYSRHFKDAKDDQFLGEASPSYLYTYKDTIKNIKEIYGESYKKLKIIIILRDPAERAWSQFQMFRRNAVEPLESFKEAISPEVVSKRLRDNWNFFYDYLGFGMYYEQVKAFVDEFPAINILTTSELESNGAEVVRDIFSFLCVEKGFIPQMKTRYNISGDIRFKRIHKFMFQKESILKKIFMAIVPVGVAQKIKHAIYSKNIVRRGVSLDVRKRLVASVFKEDILRLEELTGEDLSLWLDFK